MYSCISFGLDPQILDFAQHHGVPVNTVAYRYMSEEAFTQYLSYLNFLPKYFDTISLKTCRLYGAFFVYTNLFIPCNLTTGTPKPLCSKSCYFYRSNCYSDYSRILKYAGAILMTSIADDCENTFTIAKSLFNFTKSSKDFKDDCLDIPGIFINSLLFIKIRR